MKYNFIEIGTSDFRSLVEKMKGPGISVEPIKRYLDALPSRKDCVKVNAAISNYNGQIDLHYLSEQKIKALGLPNWARGCNSVDKPHPTIRKMLGSSYQTHATVDRVPVMDLDTLFYRYNVSTVYKLQIDTEGHDAVILWQYIQICEADKTKLAKILVFENNELSDSVEIEAIKSVLAKWYRMTERKGNVICTR